MASDRYGLEHQQMRAQWHRRLDIDGVIACARCGRPIYRDRPVAPPSLHVPSCRRHDCDGRCWVTWDLGHTDDGTTWHGPEHSCCNRRAGGRNAAAKTNLMRAREKTMVVRSW